MGHPDTWVFRPCHVLSGLVLELRAQWDWANIHFFKRVENLCGPEIFMGKRGKNLVTGVGVLMCQ